MKRLIIAVVLVVLSACSVEQFKSDWNNLPWAASNPWYGTMEFDGGTVEIALNPRRPQFIHPLLELVNGGYYNGQFVSRVSPGYFIMVGEPSLSAGNMPVQALALPKSQTEKVRTSGKWEIGIIDNQNGTYGPQLVITQGGYIAPEIPKNLNIGWVVKGREVIVNTRKGDYLRRFTLRVPHHQ